MAAHTSTSPDATALDTPVSTTDSLLQAVSRLNEMGRPAPEFNADYAMDMGSMLCMVKAGVSHGNFLRLVDERTQLSRSESSRLMRAARIFHAAPGIVKAAGTKTKLFELLVLDEGQIEELELTGRTGNLTLDDISTMTMKALRVAVSVRKAVGLPAANRSSPSDLLGDQNNPDPVPKTPTSEFLEASIEKRKVYCTALLKMMLRYTDEGDVGALSRLLEDQVLAISSRRVVPGLVAARYDLFCRFWVNGGAK